MIILHCMKKCDYQKIKNDQYYGKHLVDKDGFIHCSEFKTFIYVAPKFNKLKDELVLLCIEEDKVASKIKWEENEGIKYPHIYGELNMDALLDVMPYYRDEKGNWCIYKCVNKGVDQ